MHSIGKSIRGGWEAEVYIDVPEIGENKVLLLSTRKSGRQKNVLRANITLGEKTDFGCFTTMPFSDFNKVLIERSGMATEKAIKSLHTEAYNTIKASYERLVSEIKNHYAKEDRPQGIFALEQA